MRLAKGDRLPEPSEEFQGVEKFVLAALEGELASQNGEYRYRDDQKDLVAKRAVKFGLATFKELEKVKNGKVN